MGTHSVESQDRKTYPKCLEISQQSSQLTPLLPSMSPRRDGTKSRTLRPRPVASPLPRLVPVPLSLTTSTAVSMLVTGTHTKTLLKSLMPSSRSTTESLLMPSTSLTWTPRRSRVTLSQVCQFTPPVFVLDVTLMDLVSPPELPSSRELMLRS